MVGNYIENLPHAMSNQRISEVPIITFRSEIRVQGGRIDDVIAVWTSWHCRQVRGAIAICNAQGMEVRYDPHGIDECEGTVELKPIGGGGNPRMRDWGVHWILGLVLGSFGGIQRP